MSHSSQQPSEPAYYIEGCPIFGCGATAQHWGVSAGLWRTIFQLSIKDPSLFQFIHWKTFLLVENSITQLINRQPSIILLSLQRFPSEFLNFPGSHIMSIYELQNNPCILCWFLKQILPNFNPFENPITQLTLTGSHL